MYNENISLTNYYRPFTLSGIFGILMGMVIWTVVQLFCNIVLWPSQNENTLLSTISTLFFGFIWGLIINHWMFGKTETAFTLHPQPLKIINPAMTKTLRKTAMPIAAVLMLPISYLILSNNNTNFSNYFIAFAFVLVAMSIVLHYKVLNNTFIVSENQVMIKRNQVLLKGDKFKVNQIIPINVPILLHEQQKIKLPIGNIECLEGGIRDVTLIIQVNILFDELSRNLNCNYEMVISILQNNCIYNLLSNTSKEKTFVQKIYEALINQRFDINGWCFQINKVTVQFNLPQQSMN